jgi:hypothetical protein
VQKTISDQTEFAMTVSKAKDRRLNVLENMDHRQPFIPVGSSVTFSLGCSCDMTIAVIDGQ